MFRHNRYSEQIEIGRKGLAALLCDQRLLDLISRFPVTDETRERIRRTDFSCDSTFYFKQNSMATIWPARFLAGAVVDKDAEIVKWFLLLYSVSSVREQFRYRFLDRLGERAVSCLDLSGFYFGRQFDLYGQREREIAKLVDGVIDVRGLVGRCFPDNISVWEQEELCQAVAIFALSAGFDYVEDREHFPKKMLERCVDMPFVLASSEYISLMTGRDYDEVFNDILKEHGITGTFDDIFTMMGKESVLKQLESEKRSLEDELVHKKESIRRQETEIDIFSDSLGKGLPEETVQARADKCNSGVHRGILYKLESIAGKQLSFLDSISETGLPVPFTDLVKQEYKVILSDKELPNIITVENLADSIVAHRGFIGHFVEAVLNGTDVAPLQDDDPYDLETRIEEIETNYHCEVDRSQIHSFDGLKQFVRDEDPLMNNIVYTLSEQLGVEPEEVTLESSFTNDLGADSLDYIELLMKAEKEYGIRIPDEETSSINTVKDLYDVILEKIKYLPGI